MAAKNDARFMKKEDAYTKAEVDAKLSSVYKAAGNVTFANLPAAGSNTLGNVYNLTDAFTTTADFVEDAGHDYDSDTNVAVITPDSGTTYKYDVLAGVFDNIATKDDVVVATEEDIQDIIDGIYSDDDEEDEGGGDDPTP